MLRKRKSQNRSICSDAVKGKKSSLPEQMVISYVTPILTESFQITSKNILHEKHYVNMKHLNTLISMHHYPFNFGSNTNLCIVTWMN